MTERLPPILHFVWIGPQMPEWANRNLDEFRRLNPDHTIYVHGEDVLLDEYRNIFEALPETAYPQRSDLLRLSALQQFGGGWFFDSDFWPIRPIADIERAYCMDGSRMFVTEQRGTLRSEWPIANGVLACGPDWPGWSALNEAIASIPKKSWCGTAFGPRLFTDLSRRHREMFEVGRYGWFYPVGISGNPIGHYQRLVAGELPSRVFKRQRHQTMGQAPFVMHMWQAGKSALAEDVQSSDADRGSATDWTGISIGMAATKRQVSDATQPFNAVTTGLETLGCHVAIAEPRGRSVFPNDPSVVVCWNGRLALYKDIVARARDTGRGVIVMEHGFFDRRAYTQVDHEGILHWSSWANTLNDPAPPEGAERLRAAWPRPLLPFTGGREGYVLVLGQVPNDTQLDDSEIKTPREIVGLVAKTLPPGLEARYRPHPRVAGRNRSGSQYAVMPTCEAETLEEAIAGARFVVTINSNAGNEALALGCPVLAFGPSLYLNAGVARPATRESMRNDMLSMADGCRPHTDTVRNYLEHIACHQWTCDELAEGPVLAEILARAIPRPRPRAIVEEPIVNDRLPHGRRESLEFRREATKEALPVPRHNRTGYGVLVGNIPYRREPIWKPLLRALRGTGLPVEIIMPQEGVQPKFIPLCNCIIDETNVNVAADEFGIVL